MKFKTNVIISIVLTTIITITINKIINGHFPHIFLLELFYILLLILEKFITPLYKLKKNSVNNHKYYRDELSLYSPFINAYLLNKYIFNADVIASMNLYLKNKKYDNNKTPEENGLLPHEIDYIHNMNIYLDILRRKDYRNSKLLVFEKKVTNDMINCNLLIDNRKKTKKYVLQNELIDLVSLFYMFVHLFTYIDVGNTINNYLVIEVLYNVIWLLIYYIYIQSGFAIIRILTPYGREYLNKLHASKRFLKEFSVISSRNTDDVIIWESYLYNAILFDFKGKLDKDAKVLYKKILDTCDYYYNKNDRYIILIPYIPWIIIYIVAPFGLKVFVQNMVNICLLGFFMNRSNSFVYNSTRHPIEL